MDILEEQNERMVEAIEEGRIVFVPERYAIRENLTILKKPEIKRIPLTAHTNKQMSPIVSRGKEHPLESIKRSMDWKEKQVISELIVNFNWHIRTERKKRGLTRKQLAHMISEPEENVQKIEFGVLPSSDFVLINKIQQALGINLRKDGKDFSKSISQMMPQVSPRKQPENGKFKHLNSSREIEILDDLS
mgnify:CR=1 FL=1